MHHAAFMSIALQLKQSIHFYCVDESPGVCNVQIVISYFQYKHLKKIICITHSLHRHITDGFYSQYHLQYKNHKVMTILVPCSYQNFVELCHK